MDNDLILDSSETLGNSRNQRRRSSLFGKQSNGFANPIPDSDDTFMDTSDISPVPPSGSRPRRLATWADDTSDDIQQIRNIQMNANKQKLMDDSDNDVTPMIPDLQEVNDYEMTQTVAEPPTAHNQIISFKELDKNVLKQSAFTSLDGIDLTQLTHFCLPENQVREEDIGWSWDHLMSDITSKLTNDTDENV
ncbi:unnamed protein product [Medioppia subpectinata]|uniref:Intraflagellar transport protein 43 homolog n=1 Tax=Medioppia subpectinata TaxID=1979941 RepID=A0A7R9KDQ2_9ACAR|nr:unnamed protein product [Medioppia subpectinata]CAG2101634.1 unnamed protein product [Medioppia subpectinata]